MLSRSTDISVDGGIGVHMASITLPGEAQSFVEIAMPAKYGIGLPPFF